MKKDKQTPSLNNYNDEPETTYDLINKYGTYNIQPTADTDNSFPKIAHGLPKKENRKNAKKGD